MLDWLPRCTRAILITFVGVYGLWQPVAEAMAREDANRTLLHALAASEPHESCAYRLTISPTNLDGLTHARAKWEQVAAIWPDALGRFRQEAILAMAVGNVGGARAALDRTQDPVSTLRAAMLAATEGRFANAARLLASYYPSALQILLRRGWTLHNRGRYAEALICFEIAVHLDSTGADALLGRGRMRQMLGQHGSALTDFDRAIARCPGCYQAYLYRGQTLFVSGKGTSGEVEAAFLRAVTLAPDQFDATLQWGYWLRNRGRFAEAEEQFRKAAQLQSGRLEPFLDLADLYCLSGRMEEGISLLEEALAHFQSPRQVEQIRLRLDRCRETGDNDRP